MKRSKRREPSSLWLTLPAQQCNDSMSRYIPLLENTGTGGTADTGGPGKKYD